MSTFSKTCLFLLLTLQLGSFQEIHNYTERDKKILNRLVESMDRTDALRPPGGVANISGPLGEIAPPTKVNVSLFIRSITGIDDHEMEYSVQLTLRQEWVDTRLQYDFLNNAKAKVKYITLTEPETNIWTPDTFFTNEEESHLHKITKPNEFFRIYPSGKILYSTRISLTLSCPMDLHCFPFDKQVCSINIASWSLSTEDLILQWKDENAVQVTNNLFLKDFSLSRYYNQSKESVTKNGNYSVLKVYFELSRTFTYSYWQYYINCIGLVVISWIPFWLEQSGNSIGRVLFGLINLLAMGSYTAYINLDIPSVSYTKSIDVWNGCCLLFIFAAVIESVIISSKHFSKATPENKHTYNNQTITTELEIQEKGNISELTQHNSKWEQKVSSLRTRVSNWSPNQIDFISQIIFFIAFGVFNCIYWYKCSC